MKVPRIVAFLLCLFVTFSVAHKHRDDYRKKYGELSSSTTDNFQKITDETYAFCVPFGILPNPPEQFSAKALLKVDTKLHRESLPKIFVEWSHSGRHLAKSYLHPKKNNLLIPLRTPDGNLLNGWKEDELLNKGIFYGKIHVPKGLKPKTLRFDLGTKGSKELPKNIEDASKMCKDLLRVVGLTPPNKEADKTPQTPNKFKIKFSWNMLVAPLGGILFALCLLMCVIRCCASCRKKAIKRNYEIAALGAMPEELDEEMQHLQPNEPQQQQQQQSGEMNVVPAQPQYVYMMPSVYGGAQMAYVPHMDMPQPIVMNPEQQNQPYYPFQYPVPMYPIPMMHQQPPQQE